MTELTLILMPSYGRAARIAERVGNVHEATPEPHEVQVIVEESQRDEYLVALGDTDAQVVSNRRAANYAGACNSALEDSRTRRDWRLWFAGADDLRFHPGWLTKAAAHIDDWTTVVGTNDLLNPFVTRGWHATHYLVDRAYSEGLGGTIDQGPGIAFFEGYDHQWTDTEFIGVAKARARFRPCLNSVVEHLHFTNGKTEKDATYERAYRHLEADRQTYTQRKAAWCDLVA